MGDAKRILREIKLLRTLSSHENIIWLLDAMVSPLVPGGRPVSSLLSEYDSASSPNDRDIYIAEELS